MSLDYRKLQGTRLPIVFGLDALTQMFDPRSTYFEELRLKFPCPDKLLQDTIECNITFSLDTVCKFLLPYHSSTAIE
jgi:hypothetical protein